METTQESLECPRCGGSVKRFGHHRNGLQRFRCLYCRKTFTEAHKTAFRIEDYLQTEQGRMAIILSRCGDRPHPAAATEA